MQSVECPVLLGAAVCGHQAAKIDEKGIGASKSETSLASASSRGASRRNLRDEGFTTEEDDYEKSQLPFLWSD